MVEETPPLLSCFGKLVRARTHFHELVEAMSDFREKGHYTFDQFDNAHDDGDPVLRVQWRVRVLEPIPDTWAYVVGDAVNNMRSSLDHALAEVARRRVGLSDADVRRLKLQFPICDTPEQFRSARTRLSKDLPADVVDTLEELQPYQVADDDSSLNLQALRDLSNMDKHRQLTVVAQGVYHSTVKTDPPLELVEKRINTGALRDGAVFATVKWRRPPHAGDLVLAAEVGYVESLFVPWREDYWPVGAVLESVYVDTVLAVEDLVRDHMGPLDEFFMRAFWEAYEGQTEKILRLVATPAGIREHLEHVRGSDEQPVAPGHGGDPEESDT